MKRLIILLMVAVTISSAGYVYSKNFLPPSVKEIPAKTIFDFKLGSAFPNSKDFAETQDPDGNAPSKCSKFYRRNEESIEVVGIKPSKVVYGVTNGKLFYAYSQFPHDNFRALLLYLTTKHGNPHQHMALTRTDSYTWYWDNKSKVSIIKDSDIQKTIIVYQDNPLYDKYLDCIEGQKNK